MDQGKDMVQYSMPSRNYSWIPLKIQSVRTCDQHREMQQLRTLRQSMQVIMHRHQGAQDRLQPLRGMHGLHRQL